MAFLLSLAGLGLILVSSVAYVFQFRGEARFGSLREYLRKGWPIFAPLNCLSYMFTKPQARRPVLAMRDFAALQPIKDNWQIIRDEALALGNDAVFEQTGSANSLGQYDVGFKTFHKYGWRKFYLTWYGTTLNSASRLCPRTTEILRQIPSINGAMFAMLPAHSQLTRHLDPLAISLRFHFGLQTPNDDRCYINVDGQTRSWRDGDGFVFDETYLHFVRNDTDQSRLILMCDVERPVWGPGRLFSAVYKLIGKAFTVPNLPGDQRGLGNRVFAAVSPLVAYGKDLKGSHPLRYRLIKFTINAVLIAVPTLFVAAIVSYIAALT